MYSVGSKVVHPCYGAGTVVDIDAKRIGQIEHNYYVIDLCEARSVTQVMVPVRHADDLGLRPVGRASKLRRTLEACCEAPDEVESDYRTRRSWETEQLKSGSFTDVTEMVRDLTYRNSQRTLGLSERDTLSNGKAMLASELALATDQELESAMAEVEGHLNQMLERTAEQTEVEAA
jgi:CarD family transcriptional regulator